MSGIVTVIEASVSDELTAASEDPSVLVKSACVPVDTGTTVKLVSGQ